MMGRVEYKTGKGKIWYLSLQVQNEGTVQSALPFSDSQILNVSNPV